MREPYAQIASGTVLVAAAGFFSIMVNSVEGWIVFVLAFMGGVLVGSTGWFSGDDE